MQVRRSGPAIAPGGGGGTHIRCVHTMLPTNTHSDGEKSAGCLVHDRLLCVGTVQLLQCTLQCIVRVDQFSHECPTSYAFPLSCVRRLVSRFTLTILSGQPCAEFQMQTRVLGTRKRLSLAVTGQTTIRKDYCRHRPGQDVKRPPLLLSYTYLAGN